MRPRPVTDADVRFWEEGEPRVYACPPGLENCSPVETIVEADKLGPIVRVPWQPTEDDLSLLAAGATLWLTQWGGLAPHDLTVVPES